MAHVARQLRRYNSITLSSNRKVHFFNYGSDHTKAEVLTAGYFNDSRPALTPHSVIGAIVDHDGTPEFVRIKIATVPSSGNITVTDITGDTTPD